MTTQVFHFPPLGVEVPHPDEDVRPEPVVDPGHGRLALGLEQPPVQLGALPLGLSGWKEGGRQGESFKLN